MSRTRESGERYRVAWSLANGRGAHEALKGRGITAVKVDPDSAYVAISETNAVRDVLVAGHPAGESILIGVPLVAVSLAMETAFVDAMLLRLLLKESVNRRFMALLIANLLNATIGLALGLLWAFHHMPTFIAALDSCR